MGARKLKRRERTIYFGEEILAEVKQQKAAEPDVQEAIDDSGIMEEPAQAEVIFYGTSDTNTELNIEEDQESEDIINSEPVTHSV